MKGYITKFAFPTLLVLFLAACQSEQLAVNKAPLIVDSYLVEAPVTEQYRNFKGAVIPADLTPLSFRIEGELTKVLVKPGQRVKKGQLLAQLDDSQLKQQFIDAKAQYELANKQYQRGLTLSENNMISASELDQLTASRRIAQVSFKAAQNRLDYSQLFAPFNGYISEVPKKNFESVNPGEMILSLFRDDVVHVRIGVSDVVLATINPAAKAVKFDIHTRFSGEKRLFKIRYLEHTSEPIEGGNAFEIILEMPQVTPSILPGSTANLDVDMSQIGLGKIQGFQIPMTAIDAGQRHGQFVVWKYVDGKAIKTPIEIMQVNKYGVVAFKGIEQGQRLINSNLKRLRHEAEVTLVVKDK